MKKLRWNITKGVKVNVFDRERDYRRFLRLFKATWKRVPLSKRRLLLKHWRQGHPLIFNGPSIEFLEQWARMNDGDMAAVFCGGHQIRFCSAEMDKQPDDEITFTIAHELAHCVQEFTEPFSEKDNAEYQRRGPFFFLVEMLADEMAAEWLA